ncbi:hypothetical protein Pint_21087 [Pistacia integerrima]|uniref:Uncharacterized protein n=1 Tax=Pistacia integerrima TaxID=434235 RepID=A0ACC0XC49_9ROSI|nr:hypothetical protein Pint_21087 [Pistacia integerrima]
MDCNWHDRISNYSSTAAWLFLSVEKKQKRQRAELEAWKLWCGEHALELMDPVLAQSCVPVELLKYINIGLLCVQEDSVDRPTMSSVVVMLGSDTITLPKPTEPAFSVGRVVNLPQSSLDIKVSSTNEVTLSSVSPR